MTIQTANRNIRADFNFDSASIPSCTPLGSMEPAAVQHQLPIKWNRAEDCSILDEQGNKWIDMTSGIFVTNAGHANPAIRKALIAQLDTPLLFAYNYPTDIRSRFLNKLFAISPAHYDTAILLNSGSEALDVAYKLIKLWGRKHQRRYIITFNGSYHGRGLSNDLICGNKNKADWSGIHDDDVVFLNYPYDESVVFRHEMLPPANEIAAFILETFQGWGAWFYPEYYLRDLVTFARKAGALICCDDLQGGFYRLGTLYGYQSYGTDMVPDLLCVGKGLASSLPISAVLSRAEITNIDPMADLHGTHSGNPLCCAAALANLEYLSNPIFQSDLSHRSRTFCQGVQSLSSHPCLCQVNCRGMIAGLIVDDSDLADRIVFACVRRGVLPVWTHRNSIKLAPPLTMPVSVINEAISVIDDALCESER